MSYCIARGMRDLHGFADDRVLRVNAIAPGAVDTARFKDECKDDPQQFWKEAQATVCHSCSNLTVLFRVFYYIEKDANHSWTKRLLFANPCPANRWRRVSCILQARILVVMFMAKCSTWIVESRVRSSGQRRSVYKRP